MFESHLESLIYTNTGLYHDNGHVHIMDRSDRNLDGLWFWVFRGSGLGDCGGSMVLFEGVSAPIYECWYRVHSLI